LVKDHEFESGDGRDAKAVQVQVLIDQAMAIAKANP
jgi:hypothetical protein